MNKSMEPFLATAVFGPRRWMVNNAPGRGADSQFSTKEDASEAIKLAHAAALSALEELAAKARDIP